MALRGAQGDHPAKGREAPEARAAQPTRNDGILKTLYGYLVGVKIYGKSAGSFGGSAERVCVVLTNPICPLYRLCSIS